MNIFGQPASLHIWLSERRLTELSSGLPSLAVAAAAAAAFEPHVDACRCGQTKPQDASRQKFGHKKTKKCKSMAPIVELRAAPTFMPFFKCV